MRPQSGARTLSSLMGGNRDVALLEAFAFRDPKPVSATDACALSGMAWATAHRRIAGWMAAGILTVDSFKGKAPLYRLNTESQAVAAMVRGLRLVLTEMLESDLLREGMSETDLGGLLIFHYQGPSRDLTTVTSGTRVELDLGRPGLAALC